MLCPKNEGSFINLCTIEKGMRVDYTSSFWKTKPLGEHLTGNSPTVFVGRIGYPSVHVGILTPPDIKEDAWLYDAPRQWAKENYSIPSVLTLRGTLVNSRQICGVMERNKFTEMCQEIGLASKPVGVEVEMEKPPTQKMSFFPDAAPFGPQGQVKRAYLTENPHIDKPVDKVFSDTDLKAADAVTYLYTKGCDEAFLTKLFSIGGLGLPHQRKLVPTRWTITAVDDTLGKSLLSEIKDYPEHDCAAFYGSYLGNHYLIIFFPGIWGFELFECVIKQGKITSVSTDYESYDGRTAYAQECAGGYYTVRLAVAEKLYAAKRQARVLAIRLLTEEYTHPLGVWVTREAARKALENKPVLFSSPELGLRYAQAKIQKYFNIDISSQLKQSFLLQEQKEQKTLGSYFSAL